MRVTFVIGTRPRIIKSAPIVYAVRDFPEVEMLIVHTGQHYDYAMSREFFNELTLPDPVMNLAVGSGSHGWQMRGGVGVGGVGEGVHGAEAGCGVDAGGHELDPRGGVDGGEATYPGGSLRV